MIQGSIQIGDSSYIQSQPAQIPLAGDLDDSRGPKVEVMTPATGVTMPLVTVTLGVENVALSQRSYK